MNVNDALDIMQSDMKLWDTAEKKPIAGGKVEVTLDLPWGIGSHSVTLEGMKDAQGKRNAVGAYGEYIRGLIDEQINDEAITSRAQVAAARAEQDGSADSDSLSADAGLRDTPVPAETNAGTGKTHEVHAQEADDFGATLTARGAALSDRIIRVEFDLARWKRELTGIQAALEAMEEDDEV